MPPDHQTHTQNINILFAIVFVLDFSLWRHQLLKSNQNNHRQTFLKLIFYILFWIGKCSREAVLNESNRYIDFNSIFFQINARFNENAFRFYELNFYISLNIVNFNAYQCCETLFLHFAISFILFRLIIKKWFDFNATPWKMYVNATIMCQILNLITFIGL